MNTLLTNNILLIKCVGALLFKAQFWKDHWSKQPINTIFQYEAEESLEAARTLNNQLPDNIRFTIPATFGELNTVIRYP